ncbi:hypothetical protein BGZ61DRAFT_474866 [Ilyonectria robusta]|uniref:uncharacterized protein n=1 Tax=Ilyonectria robusta TaxID=1079257 RepID=UPI001E8E576D|nr:uncharacterized protein BGZ61DRAFT_474866 [Ilyonectria robusta]KAH8729208.1 hypothetical protein BGZ61DRAFT_474866 [Ilyonectria robusta]
MPSIAEGNVLSNQEIRPRAIRVRDDRQQRKHTTTTTTHPSSHSRSHAPAPAPTSGPAALLALSYGHGHGPSNTAPVSQAYVPEPSVDPSVPQSFASGFSNQGHSSSNTDLASSDSGPTHVDHGSPSPTTLSPPASPEPAPRSRKSLLRPRKSSPGSFESPMSSTKSAPTTRHPSLPMASTPLFPRIMAFLEKNATLHAWICILFLVLLIILICRNTWLSFIGRLCEVHLAYLSFVEAACSATLAATVGTFKNSFAYTNSAVANIYTTFSNPIHQVSSYFNPPPVIGHDIDRDLPPFLPFIGQLVDSLELTQTWIGHFEDSIPASSQNERDYLDPKKLGTLIIRARRLHKESERLGDNFAEAFLGETVTIQHLTEQMSGNSPVSPPDSAPASEWCLCSTSFWWRRCQCEDAVSQKHMADLLTTFKSALKRARETENGLKDIVIKSSRFRDEIQQLLNPLKKQETAIYSSHLASTKAPSPTPAVTPPLDLITSAIDAAQLVLGANWRFQRALQCRKILVDREIEKLNSWILRLKKLKRRPLEELRSTSGKA